MSESENVIPQNVENVALGFLALLRAVKHGVTNGFDDNVVKALEEMVEFLDFLIDDEDEKGE